MASIRFRFTVAAETLQGLLSRLCEAHAALATNGGKEPALRDNRHRNGGVVGVFDADCRFCQLEVLPLLASGAYCTVPAAMALRASCKD